MLKPEFSHSSGRITAYRCSDCELQHRDALRFDAQPHCPICNQHHTTREQATACAQAQESAALNAYMGG